jgi:hypothetical protein
VAAGNREVISGTNTHLTRKDVKMREIAGDIDELMERWKNGETMLLVMAGDIEVYDEDDIPVYKLKYEDEISGSA